MTTRDIRAMAPRELLRGLMRGNRTELKLGYSAANAVAAVKRIHSDIGDAEMRGYSQGFSDGMRRDIQPMVVDEDPANAENTAYREGYADGLREPIDLTYPSWAE